MINSIQLAVLGGQFNAGNLGVAALGLATAAQLHGCEERFGLLMQDNLGGEAEIALPSNGASIHAQALFLHASRRLRDRCGTRHVAALSRFNQWIPQWIANHSYVSNRTVKALQQVHAILDISGGDSFTDLYGMRNFRAQVDFKRLAFQIGKPLILLPQTFGPFASARSAETARSILRRADLVTTREARGLDELRTLMGDDFDPGRFVDCPDVAFSLAPGQVVLDAEPLLVAARQSGRSVWGLNVSGLLYLSQRDFGLRLEYDELIASIVKMAIDEFDSSVLLVPHVLSFDRRKGPSPTEDYDDKQACEVVLHKFGRRYHGRLDSVQGIYNAAQMKCVIGQCDYFVGARMHACIGALSQCVPASVVAYSKKVRGVMSLAGIKDTVIDPRSSGLEESLELIRQQFQNRECLRCTLEQRIPIVQQRIARFFQRELCPALVRRFVTSK